ncbi:hypothetical protein Trydic_g4089 [Trypoxylus dichotomus]
MDKVARLFNKGKNFQEQKKSPDKSENLRKVTHLYFNDKRITTINSLKGYFQLTVLYLHNNGIEKIENLDNLPNLHGLYLQRNKIRKIENLDGLKRLQRLYLGHNEVSVVENLENLGHLQELHIEKQRLNGGDKLCFDPRTMCSLSDSLNILNVSHDSIDTIQTLLPLKYLMFLNASNNNITNFSNITDTLQHLTYLREANFSGNPISKKRRYRETIIGKSNNLKMLDGKEIAEITRSFIKRFEIEKASVTHPEGTPNLPSNIADIAKKYPLSIQKTVSNYMLKPTMSSKMLNLPFSSSEQYIPWKCMPVTFGRINPKPSKVLRKHRKRYEQNTMNLSNLPNFH